MAFYPEIDDAVAMLRTLRVIRTHAIEDRQYLDDAPYPHEFVTFLQEILNVSPETQSDADVDVEGEARGLYWEMKQFRANLSIEDVTEKASMFRVCTSLLEKLLQMQQDAAGVKHYDAFKGQVMLALEKYLTPQQRTQFIDDLGDLK